METQNSNGVNERVSDAGAAQAGIVVRNSLITRLVLLVSRCYAKTREGDLHLQRGFDLLEKPGVHADLALRSYAIKTAKRTWQKCKADNRLQEVVHFRDKFTAHLGQPKNIPKPAYQDLFGFALETVTCIEKLAVAAGVANTKVEDQVNAKDSAIWRPWMVP
jgi:hypothetical protein